MRLYRAEYRRSPDTLLYLTVQDEFEQGQRMINSISDYNQQFKQNRKFYGAILPGEQLKGDENFWLPATPVMFYVYLGSEEFTE